MLNNVNKQFCNNKKRQLQKRFSLYAHVMMMMHLNNNN